jgi:hypothetical protein
MNGENERCKRAVSAIKDRGRKKDVKNADCSQDVVENKG